MESLLLLVAASLAGATLGCLTGLLPGLHVNALSAILLAALAAASSHMAYLAALFLLAVTISHTFVNIIPGTYLGAPDEAHALSVLPAHRMLLRGDGFRAIRLSALASFAAIGLSLALLWPAKWLLAAPLHGYAWIRAHLLVVLVGVAVYLVLSEPSRLGPKEWPPLARRWVARGLALVLFLASGAYGLLLFRLPYQALVPLPPSPLLPALTGLFGAATLLESLGAQARIPHQYLRIPGPRLRFAAGLRSLLAGVGAGATISLLPGLTNASATSLASAAKQGSDEEILVSLSAVNTANALFNLLMFFLFGRTRSGPMVAYDQLVTAPRWTAQVPAFLVESLFVALAAALVSLFFTIALGRFFARRIQALPYRGLATATLAYLAVLVVLFTGLVGLAVFVVGVGLGLLPIRLGLRRTHLTGVLLVPVLLYLAGG